MSRPFHSAATTLLIGGALLIGNAIKHATRTVKKVNKAIRSNFSSIDMTNLD